MFDMIRQKLILRLKETTRGILQHLPRGRAGKNSYGIVEPEFKQGNVVLQIRDYYGKSLILRNNGTISSSKHC
ncbi:hypothetical protein TNCV_1238471 [Trichonephila clavipes]|nr:hypothetical protein TNCV_1238471 [Trichonephila clavipes]